MVAVSKHDSPLFVEMLLVARQVNDINYLKKLLKEVNLCIEGKGNKATVINKPPKNLFDALARVNADDRIPDLQNRLLDFRVQLERIIHG